MIENKDFPKKHQNGYGTHNQYFSKEEEYKRKIAQEIKLQKSFFSEDEISQNGSDHQNSFLEYPLNFRKRIALKLNKVFEATIE